MKWTSLYYGQFSWSHRYQTSYNHHLYNTDSSPLRTVPLVPHGDTKIHTIVTFLITDTCPLSSVEASLCCGEAGEKEKESARGTMGSFPLPIVPRALSIFSIILFWWGYPAGASAEERGHLSITDSSHGPRDANLQKKNIASTGPLSISDSSQETPNLKQSRSQSYGYFSISDSSHRPRDKKLQAIRITIRRKRLYYHYLTQI